MMKAHWVYRLFIDGSWSYVIGSEPRVAHVNLTVSSVIGACEDVMQNKMEVHILGDFVGDIRVECKFTVYVGTALNAIRTDAL